MNLTRLLYIIATAALLANVTAYAGDEIRDDSNDETDEEEIVVIEKRENVSIPHGFGSSRIDGWYVLDNNNIVIEAGRQKYKATFMSSCPGIRYTESIGLSTMGPFELDKFTTVVLPDGWRCHIKELTVYTPEMEQKDREARDAGKQQTD